MIAEEFGGETVLERLMRVGNSPILLLFLLPTGQLDVPRLRRRVEVFEAKVVV
jgi:hypothetical protein